MRFQAFIIGLAATVLTAGSAVAGPLVLMQQAPAYNPAAFNFEGFYLGAQGGGTVGSVSAGSLGVVAGANFDLGGSVVAGGEFQGDRLFGGESSATYDFYALGRLGVVLTPSFMAYGDIGPGWTSNGSGYAFGGGGEYALTDMTSLKGEVLGTGNWGSSPSAAKLQAGILFHLQ